MCFYLVNKNIHTAMYDKYLMSKKACKIHNILIKSNTNNEITQLNKIIKIINSCQYNNNKFNRLFTVGVKYQNVNYVESRCDGLNILPIYLASCVNNNLPQIWDYFHNKNILERYAKTILPANRNAPEMFIYHKMFFYLNYCEGYETFLENKGVFEKWKNKFSVRNFLQDLQDLDTAIRYSIHTKDVMCNLVYSKLISVSPIIKALRDNVIHEKNNVLDNEEWINFEDFFVKLWKGVFEFINIMYKNDCIKNENLELYNYYLEPYYALSQELKDFINTSIKNIYDNLESNLYLIDPNNDNDNDNDNDNYAQYISDNSSAINGCIKDFIDSHTLSYSDVKDNENYYHDQHCMISLTKFYSNDNVLVFDCNHYLKINRKNRNSLSTMYRNKLSIFCPKCRYVHLSLKPTESI
jgi:hypothetical protein